MRPIQRLQWFLRPAKIETKQSNELEEIGRILDQAPGIKDIYEEILLEVNHGKSSKVALRKILRGRSC